MTERPSDPDPYLEQHLREQLAQHPRVGGLGVGVAVTAEAVVLTGSLASPEQQAAVTAAVQELMPGYHVRDETTLAELGEPTDAEPVA